MKKFRFDLLFKKNAIYQMDTRNKFVTNVLTPLTNSPHAD